jgi:hypothetical protein
MLGGALLGIPNGIACGVQHRFNRLRAHTDTG